MPDDYQPQGNCRLPVAADAPGGSAAVTIRKKISDLFLRDDWVRIEGIGNRGRICVPPPGGRRLPLQRNFLGSAAIDIR